MNTTKGLTRIKVLFLAIFATVASAGLLSAENYSGKFTLPIETKWGTATLPAGEYTFELNMDVSPYAVRVAGNGAAAFVFAAGLADRNPSGRSELILLRRGGKGIVRILHLGKEGKVFTYAVPKSERPLLAQEPQLIQRIPIVALGM